MNHPTAPNTPQDPDTPQDIGAQLAALLDYVRQCALRVERGEVMDLTSLDRTVAGMCADLTALPVARARALDPQVQDLIAALDRLAECLRRQQEEKS